MIDPLDVPLRNDPQPTFSGKFERFMLGLQQMVFDLNAAGSAYALSINTTSTTSETIGTGNKTFTVQAGLGHVVGMPVRYAFDDTNYMDGVIVSYDSGTGVEVVNFTAIVGSGTHASWSVSLGSTGDFVSKAGGAFLGAVTGIINPYDFATWDGSAKFVTEGAQQSINNTVIQVQQLSTTMLGGTEQSWQDVLASRAVDTVYTNNTGRPILVSVSTTANATGAACQLTVDSVIVASQVISSSTSSRLNVQAIVPDGSTYEYTSRSPSYWAELR